MIYLIKVFIFTFFWSFNTNATENIKNQIIFSMNNKVFTNIDFERRIEYIKIINNLKLSDLKNKNLDDILNDYISSLIFYEFNLENKILKINSKNEVENFYKANIKNKLISNIEMREEKILKKNIEIDLIRKKIIEYFLNSKKNLLNKKTNSLDLIYNYNFNYIIVNKDKIKTNKISNINNRLEFNKFRDYLDKSNIDYLFKNEDINDISIISKKLNKQIINNIKITKSIESNFVTIVSLEKNLESYDGIFVKLINFNSKNLLDEKNLDCNNLINVQKKTIFKEYEYSKLNKEIKTNLKSINDFMLFKNQDGYNYILLCDLRYDENILNALNFNKKIDTIVENIEINFINKYKQQYNFKMLNE